MHVFVASTFQSTPPSPKQVVISPCQIPGKGEAGVKLALMAMVSNKGQNAGDEDEEDQFFG